MEWIIGLGALAALYLYSTQNAAPPTATTTPPLPSPVPSPIIQSALPTSGAYQVTPESTMLASPFGALTGVGLSSVGQPTTLPAPPPYVSGGIAGNVGTGGNPLGGTLRPGLSSGTATTSLPTPAFTNVTVMQAKQLVARGYTIVAGNAYAPGQAPASWQWRGTQVIA